MANNILKKAYVGKNLAYRGYYNNQIVWDFGKCVNTDLIATLPGIAQARAGDTIDIYMYSDNFIQGKGLSKILVADNNLGQAEVQFLLNSLSQSSTAHNLAGLVQIKIGANGQIRSYAIVYTEGSVDCKMYLLATPSSASVVYNSGDLFIKWVQIAKSYAQEFSKIFFAVEGKCGGLCEPHIQNLESTIMNIEGNIKTNVFVGTLPVYTVTFMNDEVILCWARVPEGHDSPDPLNVEANETILKQQYLNPFEWWESDNISSLEFFPSKKIQIVPEGVYTIIWDGIEYSDIAKKITEEVICFGQLEESSQGNLYPIFSKFPFIILFSNQENRFIFMANDKKVSHTLTLIEKNTPVIQTPQKESTPQYYFTFSGWGRENGGEPDENALKNIMQDTIIYATFKATIRTYLITYYDDDGITKLHEELLQYGAEPTYIPSKTGYRFIEWIPTITPVVGAASYVAKWESINFGNATWAEIAAICAAGNHTNIFAVGDEKILTLTYTDGTSEDIRVVIAGMNIPCYGTDTALTIVARNALKNTMQMGNGYNYGSNGPYTKTFVHTYLNGDFIAAMPEDLQSHIKDVPLGTYSFYGSSKCRIPCAEELQITMTGNKYQDYNAQPLPYFTSNTRRIATQGIEGEPCRYWLRNQNGDGGTGYQYQVILPDGRAYNTNGSSGLPGHSSYGVVPMFYI